MEIPLQMLCGNGGCRELVDVDEVREDDVADPRLALPRHTVKRAYAYGICPRCGEIRRRADGLAKRRI
jgi:hypothetical protein